MLKDKDFLMLLKEGIPNRFLNMDPFEFEKFIAKLLIDQGFKVTVTPKSGDYGADIIIERLDEKIAVQVKRYAKDNLVGVGSINQVLGAKSFYKCNKSQLITTSSFSKQGLNLAKKTEVTLWDWEELLKNIKSLYLDGKDIYAYFKNNDEILFDKPVANNQTLTFSFDKLIFATMEEFKKDAAIIYFKIKNQSDSISHFSLTQPPLLIDILDNQFVAYARLRGEFIEGEIFPKCTVTSAWWFQKEHLPKEKIIKEIIAYYSENNSEEKRAVIIRPKDIIAVDEKKQCEGYLKKPYKDDKNKDTNLSEKEHQRQKTNKLSANNHIKNEDSIHKPFFHLLHWVIFSICFLCALIIWIQLSIK